MTDHLPAVALTDDVGADGRGELTLGPATRLLWRGPDVVELGLGTTGVVVEGLSAHTVRSLAGRTAGPPSEQDRPALDILHRAGYLWPRASTLAEDPRLAPPAPWLTAELRGLQVRHGQTAAQVLAARRFATVSVEGASRVAAQVAAVLAASGVGRVLCAGPGRVRLGQHAVGGITPEQEGVTVAEAARQAVRRAGPDVDQTPLGPDERPDLAVLALDHPLPEERRAALHADGTAYLCVTVQLDRGIVGPLVVPGVTSCPRCADLVRRDLDPAWDALAVQLTTPGRYGPAAGAALTTLVSGAAALQALDYLDGGHPVTADGTLELVEPDWRLRRRSWPLHPDCGCVECASPS